MAIIKCEECGGKVSDTAEKCPHCGAAVPKKTSPFHKLLAGLMLVVVLSWVFSGSSEPDVPKAPKTAAEIQKDKEFSQVVAALSTLKAGMKNPDSFQVVQALMVQGPTICITYRGTNSFNAVVTNHIAIWDKGNSSDPNEWNKRCANKQGDNYTHAGSVI